MKRFLLMVPVALLGCAGPTDDHGHGDGGHTHGDDEGWAVTAWGEHYEVFAEADPLLTGHVSRSHTHVTILDGFQPLQEGVVSIVLRRTGTEITFRQSEALRDGIFDVSITPVKAGEFDLFFLVEADGSSEEISAGRVRIGDIDAGGLLESPVSLSGAGEPVDFLKEQQWRIDFATEWTGAGSISGSIRGPGHVRPRAGGEVVLTAPMDGLVSGDPWPYPGLFVAEDAVVFGLLPLVSQEHSLSELQAEVAEARANLNPAKAQLDRLEELLEKEAVSTREVEIARGEVEALNARLVATEQDLATARLARRGVGEGGENITLKAPFAGRVSTVMVTRGQVVAAGEPLGRVVQPDPVWIEVALRSVDASRVRRDPSGLHVTGIGGGKGVSFGAESVRLVSRSPEVDPETGAVTVLYEVDDPEDRLILGTAVQAEIGLNETIAGIVIPESAIVDDAGIPVVYLQETGEAFVRREIEILGRQGSQVLVSGLDFDLRLVTHGGAAIRRTSLISSGGAHGHVH